MGRGAVRIMIALMLASLLLGLPAKAGYAELPASWTPGEIALFIKGVATYWVELLGIILSELLKAFQF